MSQSVFRKVLVPVAFEHTRPKQVAADHAVSLPAGEWITVNDATVAALKMAATLAQGGTLVVLHATPDYRTVAAYGSTEGLWLEDRGVNELDARAMESSTAAMEKLAAIHCEGTSVRALAAPGKAIDVIMDAADEEKPDLIVLAASGHGVVRRAVLGSTADRVIRRAQCPVMVLPTP